MGEWETTGGFVVLSTLMERWNFNAHRVMCVIGEQGMEYGGSQGGDENGDRELRMIFVGSQTEDGIHGITPRYEIRAIPYTL